MIDSDQQHPVISKIQWLNGFIIKWLFNYSTPQWSNDGQTNDGQYTSIASSTIETMVKSPYNGQIISNPIDGS